ncbi:hypothetical protein LTR09_006578 [Extremus antarcticus]|uniref:NmrA-like domain-containing protein n=1 Tax=Extremus antarcticus TaxID=702011 RepID=A0AAJ0DEK8_9PEZI|nr:hypothetical protein LTR09_006578 [Extremus antarcticus]
MSWWEGKERIREYLREVNKDSPVIEYSLFQPGLFLDYLAFPHKTSKYVDPLQTVFDFQNKRGIIARGHEHAIMTLTTVSDLAAIVTRAIEYEGRWPTSGGIQGNRLTFSQIYEIGARVRGCPFDISTVELHDLEAGKLKVSWGLETSHHAVSGDEADALLRAVPIGVLLSSTKGAWDSSVEMNELFPDHKFTSAEEFLSRVWTASVDRGNLRPWDLHR